MIRDREQIKEEIKNKSKEIIVKKLHYLQYYNPVVNNYPKNEYKFEEKCPFSKDNIFIGPFFQLLRDSQEYVFQLLTNANSFEQFRALSMFFCDFFYSNIFSEKTVDNELLFMIYRTIDKEISLIKNETKGLFLKNSINTYLLSTLVKQNDVQEYFKIVLKDVVEEIDEKYSQDLSLDISNLINKKKENQEDNKFKEFQKANTLRDSIFTPGTTKGNEDSLDMMDDDEFYAEYVPPLDKEELLRERGKVTDVRIQEYIDNQIGMLDNSKNKDLFAVSYYLEKKINQYDDSAIIIDIFKDNFKVLVYCLNKILKDFESSLDIIPQNIKYICKIISILIKKKFNNLPQFAVNSYIGKFFISILLKTAMENPLYFRLFNSFYLTKNTQKNIDMIFYLLNVMVSGTFFTFLDNNGAFSIFNKFFIKKMPTLFHIFDSLVDVDLPPILQKFDMPNFNPADYSYDFIKEEQNEVIRDYSYVYSPEQFISMLKIMKANQSKFNEISKAKKDGMAVTLQHLFDPHHYNLYEKEFKNNRSTNSISFYYVPGNYMTDEGKAIWAYTPPPFSLPEEKKAKKEDFYLVKVKNALCKILYSFIKIPKDNLFGIEVKTTEDFMNAIKKLTMFKSLTMDCSKDSEWYYFTLKTFLGRIDKSYAENDYFKLYDEIQNDVTTSLNNINFQYMSELEGAMRFVSSKISQIETNIQIIDNVQNTKYAQLFINRAKIEAFIRNVVDEDTEERDIKVVTQGVIAQYKKNLKTIKKFKKIPIYETVIKKQENPLYSIEDFIKYFPDVSSIYQETEIDVLDAMVRNNIATEVNYYLAAVRENLQLQQQKELKNGTITKTLDPSQIDRIHLKVVNYILNRLYSKLYPKDSDPSDGAVFSKCVELAWVEPSHFIDSANKLNLEDILPTCIRLIKQIQKEKSPYIKKDLMENVVDLLDHSMSIYLDKYEHTLDEQLPFVIYMVIKAQPEKLSTDLRFTSMFFKEQQHKIAVFQSVAEYIKKINRDSFVAYNVSPDEYDLYCDRARKGEIVN